MNTSPRGGCQGSRPPPSNRTSCSSHRSEPAQQQPQKIKPFSSKNSYSKSSAHHNHFHALPTYTVGLIPNKLFQLFKLLGSHYEKICPFDPSSNFLTIDNVLPKAVCLPILLQICYMYHTLISNLST